MATRRESAEERDRRRRMKWWHEARFGMFIHWGIFTIIGREGWAIHRERMPFDEWEPLADGIKPKGNPARAWAKLARQAGQKYMVLTTKGHEGFCLFDSALTDYCAPKRAAGRDIVADYVEAARAEGMRVGFYYSLMDWHHPDGDRCARDEKARRRFVDYIHGQVRELCTNYGKVDVLWYDVSRPLDAEGWESAKMNRMVRELQPDIIINDRSQLPEDFATPEQKIEAAPPGRPWESCMTVSDQWGYNPGCRHWKSVHECVQNLVRCAAQGGNFLLNINVRPDGSITPQDRRVFQGIGDWMSRNEEAIRDTDRGPVGSVPYLMTTRGKTLYVHIFAWPGREFILGGLRSKVKSARLLATGRKLRVRQKGDRLIVTGLPGKAPDSPASVIALECTSRPKRVLPPASVGGSGGRARRP
ncbi:MAG: alpha-L-fucosidase [Planctomycetes bacterium]|nr:alpha-L-fucosidase [Planctomycetota bacterium]